VNASGLLFLDDLPVGPLRERDPCNRRGPDPDVCLRRPGGKRWHTAACTIRLLVDGSAPVAGGIVGDGRELTWPKPTRPGDAAGAQRGDRDQSVAIQSRPAES
jgi:hypothetical protein